VSLDPKVFGSNPYGPWPARGDYIQVLTREGRAFTGRVVVVWLAMDVVAIDVEVYTGGHGRPSGRGIRHCVPEEGDAWQPAGRSAPEQVRAWNALSHLKAV
jgi:hypothetical protein